MTWSATCSNEKKRDEQKEEGVEMKALYKLYGMLNDRKGATMAEYAVIAAVLILVAIIAFTSLGSTIVAKINDLVSNM
jgi:pilus assembly protein Flp/PilA